jgi:response regulator RpfG family c-di-GMP phosphodiesterase
MAADVALAQALAYARDLRALYEVSRAREEEANRAHDKLRAAYQQALAYAVDLRKSHRQMQRSVLQSLLGLANALEAAGLGIAEAKTIAEAGLLHDLGKIGVPEHILRKQGPLTDEEWIAMRRHPLTGAQIVAPLEFFADAALIIRHHHERHDGSGYPDGLKGDGIPVGARIVAIADVYDALTSERPYRRKLARAEAVQIMRDDAGLTLDPRLIELFLDLVIDAPADRSV